MKGVALAQQIECECGNLVENVKQDAGRLPLLVTFVASCQCGRKFFTHIQETKPDAKK